MPIIRLEPLPPRHKLRIQLIPETSWYYNLRKVLPKHKWDWLRKRVYLYFQYQCASCGASGRIHAHEVWKFDKRTKTQKLIRIVALCELCHAVEHFGHTEMSHKGSYVRRVIHHGMKVMKCSFNQFAGKRARAFELWQHRNMYDWKVDFGPYANYVKEATKNGIKL